MAYESTDGVRYLLNSIVIQLEHLGHADKADDIQRVKEELIEGRMSYERAAGDIVLAITLAAMRVPHSPVTPPDKLPMTE